MKKLFYLIFIGIIFISSCRDAAVVNQNITKAADQFEIYRRVEFYNGITDSYILTIEGYCAIFDTGNQLEVIVKTDNGMFIKHFLGLSDNVSYFAEQLDTVSISDAQYRVIFKPSVIVPNIDIK